MLFGIFVAMCVVGVLWLVKYDKDYVGPFAGEWNWWVGIFLTILGGMGFLISIILFCCAYWNVDGYVAQMNQRHDILTYQIEQKMYNNDNEYGKKELMEKVQAWNEDLAYNKNMQQNLVVGIYIPNVYDEFEFIDFSNME